jgi:hypothetical protein
MRYKKRWDQGQKQAENRQERYKATIPIANMMSVPQPNSSTARNHGKGDQTGEKRNQQPPSECLIELMCAFPGKKERQEDIH